jgi:hypothetical protein
MAAIDSGHRAEASASRGDVAASVATGFTAPGAGVRAVRNGSRPGEIHAVFIIAPQTAPI